MKKTTAQLLAMASMMGGGLRALPKRHYNSQQSDEDRARQLAKAAAKRERKRLKLAGALITDEHLDYHKVIYCPSTKCAEFRVTRPGYYLCLQPCDEYVAFHCDLCGEQGRLPYAPGVKRGFSRNLPPQ